MRLAGRSVDEDSALYPLIAFLRMTAHLEPDDPPDVQLAKLRSLLAGDEAVKRAVLPVLAELVGMPSDDAAMRALSPEQLRERMFSVLIEQVLLLARDRPLCLVIEDVHWLDPTSLELVGRMAESIAGRPVMILMTARDGFEATWMADRTTTVVRLSPLSPADVAGMVQSLFTDRDIPPHLGRVIARRTDGVPLFVEEVARALLQAHSLDDLGDDSIELPDRAVPASLHESLMARLDRSGVAKHIAQIAAVIGRTARRDMLAAVAALPGHELDQPLATLRDAGVMISEFVEGAEGYTFSHALLRDAAYDSLVRDDRRRLHLRVARALEALDPQAVAQRPELLAMHLAEGNEAVAAAPHWLEAARRSLARSALTEATRLLKRGLDALEKLPVSDPVRRLRLQMSGLLGPALIGLKGPGSPRRRRFTPTPMRYAARCRRSHRTSPSTGAGGGSRRASMLGCSARMRSCNVRSNTVIRNFCCRRTTASGRAITTPATSRVAASISRPGWRSTNAATIAITPRCTETTTRRCAHMASGRSCCGCRAGRGARSRRSARRWHGPSRSIITAAVCMRPILACCIRSIAATMRRCSAARRSWSASPRRTRCRTTAPRALIFRGWIIAIQDDPMAGLRTLLEGLAHQRSGTAREDFPVYLCLLAEAQMAAGQPEQAAEELRQRTAGV